ncbi:MAG TPA: hypothetical protein H9774_13680 [Candidatus Desulfovibrio gallistercoris]|nr:hypothetical protein [Candidatus Desulfovibrio gallistercoris]
MRTLPLSGCRAARGLMLLLPLLVAALLMAACTAGRTPGRGTGAAVRPEARLPRADPGYVQWLERQSMLGAAPLLAGQVSGTERIWSNSALSKNRSLLLTAASNWLEVDPYTVGASDGVLAALGGSLPPLLGQLGIGGLYVSPTGERGDIWQEAPRVGTADNVTALHFDKAVGTDEDLTRLQGRLEAAHIQLGGELPPAATGLGPDFILQARHAPRFDGLYAMISVPRDLWASLPSVPGEWDCLALRPEAVSALQARGLLPPTLLRQKLAWAEPGGWAATGEVRGTDGQIRRWVYRFADDPQRPVLLWQDPSGQARRIFSAAIIRHTGLQGQALAGLRLEALFGLDVPPPAGEGSAASLSDRLTPGYGALVAAAREVHRYGGWAVQADALPPSLLAPVLRMGVDFSRDSLTAPAAEYALLSGDAAPLARLLRQALESDLDQTRLARGLHGWQGVDWRLLRDLPDGERLVSEARRLSGLDGEDFRLWTTPTSLAARALGLDAEAALRPENAEKLRRASLALLSCRAGLPGPLFISLQELTGALDVPRSVSRDILPSRGLVPLPDASARSGAVPSAPLAFGPLREQMAAQDSFLMLAARLLLARQAAGLAQGKLVSVQQAGGCLALCSSLPEGGYWLTVINLSGREREFSVQLPAAGDMLDIFSGQSLSAGRRLSLNLAAYQSRHLVMDAHAATSAP